MLTPAEVLPLLAGVVMNFPFKELPSIRECAWKTRRCRFSSFHTRAGYRRSCWFLPPAVSSGARSDSDRGPGSRPAALDRNTAEFFLDEDPMTFHGRLALQVAGSLAFVPGSEYRSRSGSGVLA